MKKVLNIFEIFMIILCVILLAIVIGGIFWWALGSFFVFAFGIDFVFTYLQGIAVALLVLSLSPIALRFKPSDIFTEDDDSIE